MTITRMKTRNPRIKIETYGPGIWRTVAQDDCGSWDVTGPPYDTKAEALCAVADVERNYFGIVSDDLLADYLVLAYTKAGTPSEAAVEELEEAAINALSARPGKPSAPTVAVSYREAARRFSVQILDNGDQKAHD